MWNLESQNKRDYWTLNVDRLYSLQLESYTYALGKLDEYEYDWDLLIIEIWLETGSIIFYPTAKCKKVRDEPVLFKISFNDLALKYSEISLLIEESEEAFEVAYDEMLDEVVGFISKLASSVFNERDDATGVMLVDPDMEVLSILSCPSR